MNCRYFGELKLHDGNKVRLTDKKTADLIDAEFQWLNREVTGSCTKFTIRAVQCLFALKLGDKYGWTTDRITRLLKDVAFDAAQIVDDEITLDEEFEYLRDAYGIDLMADGMIKVEHVIDDYLYDVGEWRPLAQRKPQRPGSYQITTAHGGVCAARWDGERFNGTAGRCAVAWRERPQPWEFWKEWKEKKENA